MKIKRIWILIALAIMLAVVLTSAGIAGAQSVAQDAYPPVIVGSATVTPSTGGCVGGTVTIAGTGMPANSAVIVAMGTDTATDSFMALLGTPMADGAGNWSLTAVIPATVTRASDSASVATWAGNWQVAGVADDLVSTNLGTLIVQNCTVATTLPSTGAPIAALGLLAVGLLTTTGVGLRMLRNRQHQH